MTDNGQKISTYRQ